MTDHEAMSIYQDYLDRTSAALVGRDAETFLRHIFLPHLLETENEVIHIPDAAAARRHFEGFAGALAAQNVDAYTRIARTAVRDGDRRIHGTHDSFLTSGGKLVVPAFSNDTILELHDGQWIATRIRHHTRYVSWPDVLPRAKE